MFGIRLPRRAVLSRRRPARTWESEGPFPQLRALREEDFFFELSTFTEVFHYALLLGSPPLAGSAGFATRDIFQPLGNCWTLLRKFKHCVLHGAPRVGLDTGKRCVFWKVFEKFLRLWKLGLHSSQDIAFQHIVKHCIEQTPHCTIDTLELVHVQNKTYSFVQNARITSKSD